MTYQLPGFDIKPMTIDGKDIGLVAMRDHEIHVKIDPFEALKHARRIIKEYIAPQLGALGYLLTISTGDKETEHFLSRLGFVPVSSCGSITTHRLDALKIK
jgi:hypothetical protein